jgi:hypothetical protein
MTNDTRLGAVAVALLCKLAKGPSAGAGGGSRVTAQLETARRPHELRTSLSDIC